MKKIFIHIGYPRAGSTFLQEKIFKYFDGKCVAYNPGKFSQALLPEFMRYTYISEGYTKKDLEILKYKSWEIFNKLPQDKILISNEGLCGLGFQPWERTIQFRDMLYEIFPNATILIVFRNQNEWLRSSYYLALKYGYLVPFNKYVNYCDEKFVHRKPEDYWTYDALELNYSKLFNIYKEKFKDIYVINFDSIKNGSENLIPNFEKLIKCKIKLEKIFKQKVNKSLETRELKMIGIIAGILKYELFWDEKYTFIPGQFNTSFRTSNSLKIKIQYLLINAFRFCCFYSGRILGKIFFSKNAFLFDKKQIKILQKLYFNENKRFVDKCRKEGILL